MGHEKKEIDFKSEIKDGMRIDWDVPIEMDDELIRLNKELDNYIYEDVELSDDFIFRYELPSVDSILHESSKKLLDENYILELNKKSKNVQSNEFKLDFSKIYQNTFLFGIILILANLL